MFIFIATLLSLLSGLEVDLFIPSFPELQRLFELTPFEVELTLGVNFIACCFFSLIVGSMSDRYGRKIPLIVGLLFFVLGSVLCVCAPSFTILLIGRFLQGAGIAAPSVIAYVMVADRYPPEKQVKVLGILNGTCGLAMAFAPVLGSYISLWFGWRANFLMLLICGAITLLFSIFGVRDSHPRDTSVSLSLKVYTPLFAHRNCLLFMLGLSFLMVSYWTFVAMSPIFYIQDMKTSLVHFGFYQGVLAATFGLVSIFSGKILEIFSSKKCFYFSLWLVIASTIALFFCGLFQVNDPVVITGICLFWAAGCSIPFNVLYPQLLECLPGARGRISALVSSIRLLLTAFAIQVVSFFHDGSFLVIGIAIFVFNMLFIFLFFRLKKQGVIRI